MNDLERICPIGAARRRLVQLDIEQVNDEPAVVAIFDAAADIDSDMAEAAAHKAEGNGGKTTQGKLALKRRSGCASVTSLRRMSLAAVGIAEQTTNTTDTVDAKGESGSTSKIGFRRLSFFGTLHLLVHVSCTVRRKAVNVSMFDVICFCTEVDTLASPRRAEPRGSGSAEIDHAI